MKTSEHINELASALAKAQATIKPPAKNKTATVPTKTGGSYKYSYADLADIIDAIRVPLSENGLSITSGTEQNGHTILCTRLMHQSGQWIEATYPILDGLSAQQIGSAITYGRRYTTCALVGIVAEDDDDGEAAEVAPKQEQNKGGRKPSPPKPEPAKPSDPKKAEPPKAGGNLWIGSIVKIESPRNGVWKLTGGDAEATEFGTATPEHVAVAKSAQDSKVRVALKFATQTMNNVKRILSIEPILEEVSNVQ